MSWSCVIFLSDVIFGLFLCAYFVFVWVFICSIVVKRSRFRAGDGLPPRKGRRRGGFHHYADVLRFIRLRFLREGLPGQVNEESKEMQILACLENVRWGEVSRSGSCSCCLPKNKFVVRGPKGV